MIHLPTRRNAELWQQRARAEILAADLFRSRRTLQSVRELCEDAQREGHDAIDVDSILTLLDGKDLPQLEGGEL